MGSGGGGGVVVHLNASLPPCLPVLSWQSDEQKSARAWGAINNISLGVIMHSSAAGPHKARLILLLLLLHLLLHLLFFDHVCALGK